MNKKILAILIAAVMIFCCVGLTGCGQQKAPEPVQEPPVEAAAEEGTLEGADEMAEEEKQAKTIGIAIYSMGADSCVLLVEDAKKAAEKYGYEIMLLDANGDPATQADQMGTFVSSGVDAIILNPTDTTSLIPSIKNAVDAGIPVIGVGMEMDQEAMDMLLFFAGMDDYSIALAGCNWIVDNYGGQAAEVAVITGNAGTDPTNKTISAFNEALNGSDLVNLGEYAADFDTAKAMAVMEDLLVEHPDIKAVFCQDHVMAAGAAEAISDAGKTGEVAVVATVGVTDYLSYVDEDLITSAAYVLLWKCGSFAIDTIADYFENGTQPAAKYYVAPVMITKDNLAEADSVAFQFDPAA